MSDDMSEVSGRTELRELLADIRHWRRGRANTTWGEVLSDAYVAVIGVLIIGSMAGNAFLQLGNLSREACSSPGCLAARGVLPALATGVMVALVLAIARMTGPVFLTPAASSWLATSPVERSALLRPRLWLVSIAGGTAVAIAAAAVGLLGGFEPGALAGLVVTAAALGVIAVSTAARAQAGRRGTLALRVATGLLVLTIWCGMFALATGRISATASLHSASFWWIAALATLVLAGVCLGIAARSVGLLPQRQFSPGGHLMPGISGALAGLDFSLAYDVWLAQKWRLVEAVRSRRQGPSGSATLLYAEFVRLRRSPSALLGPAAVVVVPYVAHTAGAERSTALIAALALFGPLLPLLSGMRVLSRSPGLARMLPWPLQESRIMSLLVALVVAAAAGLAMSPALRDSFETDASVGTRLGLAVALTALVAAVRWMCASPPDYGRPLIVSPAGAVPANLYASVFRGFDMVILGTAPLLLFSPSTGAWVSLGVMGVVLTFLVYAD